jgi:hypothetical protein
MMHGQTQIKYTLQNLLRAPLFIGCKDLEKSKLYLNYMQTKYKLYSHDNTEQNKIYEMMS